MTIERAFEIVYELAEQNALDPDYDDRDLKEEALEQQEALEMVRGFIDNMKESK